MIIKMEPKITLDELIDRIEYADHDEIDPIIDALQRRYTRLFPDWDVVFLSAPTGSEEALKQQGQLMIDFIEKHWLKK